MDSVYRVVNFQRGTLNATKDGVTGTPVNTQTWQLDGVGNWATTTMDGVAKTQTINEMNEYEAFAGVAQAHDDNGNLTDDGNLLFIYDFANRLLEARKKADNSIVAKYGYDSMNRRTSKTFTRTKGVPPTQGEYQTDANTMVLYHFNETTGTFADSSGNGNDIRARNVVKTVPGLYGNAIQFRGIPLIVPRFKALQNVTNQLTVEASIYLRGIGPRGRIGINGDLVSSPAVFGLSIRERDHKLTFYLHVKNKRPIEIESNTGLPVGQWIHVAAVYNGTEVALYVNGAKQTETARISGNVGVFKFSPLMLGGMGFMGRMEEMRLSNTARTSFPDLSQTNRAIRAATTTVKETVYRTMYYNGWQMIEEYECTAAEGQQLGDERLTRTFVDGIGIDEHLCSEIYAEDGTVEARYWYHANYRGDTVALTDDTGNVVVKLAYTAYGEASKIKDDGTLETFTDTEMVRYCFQSREVDSETGTMHFRNRQYSVTQGRFLQRDPMGYVDGMGLYEGFGCQPYNYIDSFGLERYTSDVYKRHRELSLESIRKSIVTAERKKAFFCVINKMRENWDKFVQSGGRHNFAGGNFDEDKQQILIHGFIQRLSYPDDNNYIKPQNMDEAEIFVNKWAINSIDYLVKNYRPEDIYIGPYPSSLNFIVIQMPVYDFYNRAGVVYILTSLIHEPWHDGRRAGEGHSIYITRSLRQVIQGVIWRDYGKVWYYFFSSPAIKDFNKPVEDAVHAMIVVFDTSTPTKAVCKTCPNMNRTLHTLWDEMLCDCGIHF